jgi:hypothetical protein
MKLTHSEWLKESEKRYPDGNVAFICPVCKHRQTVSEYRSVNAPDGTIGFSCIGRFLDTCRAAFGGPGAGKERSGPCDYAGGGLFPLNPITIVCKKPDGSEEEIQIFDFADDPLEGSPRG